MYAWGKKGKMLLFTGVYVCVKAKLTLVSFFSPFFAPFPYDYDANFTDWFKIQVFCLQKRNENKSKLYCVTKGYFNFYFLLMFVDMHEEHNGTV